MFDWRAFCMWIFSVRLKRAGRRQHCKVGRFSLGSEAFFVSVVDFARMLTSRAFGRSLLLLGYSPRRRTRTAPVPYDTLPNSKQGNKPWRHIIITHHDPTTATVINNKHRLLLHSPTSMMRIHLLWSSLALTATQVSSQADTCDGVINCHPGSTCVQGVADYSIHPEDSNGVPFSFLQETSKEGWHCDCPDDMTGLRCNRPFQQCNGTDHICYHGGKCIDGIDDVVAADELFCDCKGAEHNGMPYVGKYCEVEGALQCGDSEVFCTNGGTCEADFEDRPHPCECKQGHRGPHCEFDTGFVPDCDDLECENGGACTLGIKDYDTAIHSEFWARHDGNFKYCECPEGFYGPKCEVTGEKCGDDTCFNGAKCLETEHSDGQVDFTCDCSTASNEETSFAGEFCENEADTFCSKNEDQNGQLFCVNGGTCNEEEHTGCDCAAGFHGPICEFRDGQAANECRLKCQNGGKCRSGKKDNKLFEQFGDELKKFNETHRLWEHCVCPEGFFGIQCEHQLEICPGGEHVCLHGSKCVPDEETKEEEDKHTCDCDEAYNSMEQYAGRFCQYTSTDICTKTGKPGVGKANFAFCVNNGKCKAKVAQNEQHPGCDCTKGFTGPHCEFLNTKALVASANQAKDDGLDQNEGLVVTLAVLMLLLVALIGGALLRRRCASSEKEEDSAMKEEPPTPSSDTDTYIGSGAVAEETVDMQSPMGSDVPPMVAKDLQTVEII